MVLTNITTTRAQNYVSSGSEIAIYNSLDLATSTSWITDRSASPGYFSWVNGNTAYTGGDDLHNINGYVKYYVTTANQGFTFPVGNGSDLRQLIISGNISNGLVLATAWISGNPSSNLDPTTPNSGSHSTSSVGSGIATVYNGGQWDWVELSGSANGTTVTVSIPNLATFGNASLLRLVGWNGSQWINLSGNIGASNNTENSTLSGTMQAGITALSVGVACSLTANAGSDVTVTCTNPSVSLTASGGSIYAWSNGANTSSTVVSPSSTTTYTVTVTDVNGCSSTDQVLVTVAVCTDTDGDGIADAIDADDDNDGIFDTVEQAICSSNSATCDTDGDGIPNHLDLDSDNDGINDVVEVGLTDANGDGIADGTIGANGAIPGAVSNLASLPNKDGDANKDPYDALNGTTPDGISAGLPASTFDPTTGQVLCSTNCDPDKDGLIGSVDGLPTAWGDAPDTDGDGIADALDVDDDNDGILDTVEQSACSPSSLTCDTDGDGIPNHLDLDSDNDGINDVLEAGLADASGDGKADGTVGANGAIPSAISNLASLPNKDGDANKDPYDALNGTTPDGISAGLPASTFDPTTGQVLCSTNCDPDKDGIIGSVDGLPMTWGDKDILLDTDGDGISNSTDLDDDNDGIFDTVEQAICSSNSATCDTDGDGIPNHLDLDSDNDGINDILEAGGIDANKDGFADGTPNSQGIPSSASTGLTPPDMDGDGAKDFVDLDSDNDAVSDLIESGNPTLTDANNDGMVDGTDPDSDGLLGAADDSTLWGDANDPAPLNTDGTDKPNYLDSDSDNDGVFDIVEIAKKPTLDTNNDGKIDTATDSDKDGIADVIDTKPGVFGGISAPDSDGDGVPDSIDVDDDNDGVLDSVEGTVDSDSDGVPNNLDLDSDNDGINDVREAYPSSTNVDANNDGIKDGTASSSGLVGTAVTPVNSDNDANPDMLDLDSDNDAISDLVESGNTSLVDADKDGVVDGTDTDGDGITESADTKIGYGDQNDPLPANSDANDEPNYRDLDSNNNGVTDITEGGYIAVDTNNDGRIDNPADTDNDGIANAVDTKPSTWGGLAPKSSVTMNIKVLLQGAMLGSIGTTMRDDLRTGNYVPLSDPYRTAPYNAEFLHVLNPNTQTTTSSILANTDANNAIVDWVFVELRNSANPSSVVATMSALVQRDGDVVKASDGVSPILIDVPAGNYYVAIRHRNHLGVMTATPISLDITPVVIDFTSMTDAQVYNSTATYDGYEMTTVNGKRALWAGNSNMDTKAKYAGLSNDSNVTLTEVLGHSGNTNLNYSYNNCLGYFQGDVNMDGKSKYNGLNNDINYILNNVFNYGLNSSKNYSYNLLVEQLP